MTVAAPAQQVLKDLNFFVFAKPREDGTIKYTVTQHIRDKRKRLNALNEDAEDIILTGDDRDYNMYFYLCDGTNLGLTFADDPFAAHWGSGCPAAGALPDQWSVSKENTHKIVVFNPADDKRRYRYMLRFKDRANTPYDFDPIIKNGGGGSNLLGYFTELLYALFPFLRR